MKRLVLICFVGLSATFTSCRVNSITGVTQSSQVQLSKGEYELSDIKTATGETEIILGISLKNNDKAGSVSTYSTHGSEGMIVPTGCCIASIMDPVATAKAVALYNLMEANPGYDAVMSPNFKMDHSVPCGIPIYTRTTVTVSARLVKLKK